MQYAKLKVEYDAAIARGDLTGVEAPDVAASVLSALTTMRNRSIVPAHEVFEAIDPVEFAALTNAERQTIFGMLAMGAIDFNGPNTRKAFGRIFGTGTVSRTALVALQQETVSLLGEIGWQSVGAKDILRIR